MNTICLDKFYSKFIKLYHVIYRHISKWGERKNIPLCAAQSQHQNKQGKVPYCVEMCVCVTHCERDSGDTVWNTILSYVYSEKVAL